MLWRIRVVTTRHYAEISLRHDTTDNPALAYPTMFTNARSQKGTTPCPPILRTSLCICVCIHKRAFANDAHRHPQPSFMNARSQVCTWAHSLCTLFLIASSFPIMQSYLLDHSIKLVELLITGSPGDRSQSLDQWTWDSTETIPSFWPQRGVVSHPTHPQGLTRPFRHRDEMDYDGKLNTLINRKAVRARPGMQDFLCEVLEFVHVIVWSSMVMENTESIVHFLFHDLPSPCLVLGQEACDELFDEKGRPVPKFGDQGGGQQFLKVLGSRLWRGVPLLEGVPHGHWPTLENTLLIDDSPIKSILNPQGNVIFLDTWTSDRKDTFLVDSLAPYLRRLELHPGSIPDFVRSNPIGNAALSPRDNVYKSIVRLAGRRFSEPLRLPKARTRQRKKISWTD